MSDWDFLTTFYNKNETIYEVSHKGAHSLQMDVDIFVERMRRGDGDRIVIRDLRPKWRREQHGTAWWASDLTQVIQRGGRPSWQSRNEGTEDA